MNFVQKFPKIIHQIWLGDKKMPRQFSSYMESWKRFHPKWKYILWTDTDFPLINTNVFNQTDNFGIKSDVLRYEILYKFGGLYVDLDFECFKPLDPLLERMQKNVFAASEGKTPTYSNSVANAMIGALPNSEFLEKAIEELPINFKKTYTDKGDTDFVEMVSKSCGPAFITSLHKKYPNLLHVFQRLKFYPRTKEPDGDAYARHHYSGLWK